MHEGNGQVPRPEPSKQPQSQIVAGLIFSGMKVLISLNIILYGENMTTCLRALGAGWIPVMSDLLHVLEPSFERGSQSLKATPPITIAPIVLTTRPWLTRPNGLALAVWYQAPGTTTGTILLWAVYTWYWCIALILVWRKHPNMSPCTNSRVNTNYERVLQNVQDDLKPGVYV